MLPPHPVHTVKNPNVMYSQAGQDEGVYKIFPKENGFFIEMGAFDGKHLSNTLWLERRHGWAGLLIEANPDLCRQIDAHKRHVWRLCACILGNQNSVDFIKDDVFGGMKAVEKQIHLLKSPEVAKVPCYSMKTVLDKIGIHYIDYFSLDVEGAELLVLESMRDDLLSGRLTVDVWTVEFLVKSNNYVDSFKTDDKLNKIKQFFSEIGGYFPHSTANLATGEPIDVVFVNIKTWCKLHDRLPNEKSCKSNH